METTNIFTLSAYVLWRLNYIHPFVNGNGRTSRACCYFVFCLKFGILPETEEILPELLKENKKEYVNALRSTDTLMRTPSKSSLEKK